MTLIPSSRRERRELEQSQQAATDRALQHLRGARAQAGRAPTPPAAEIPATVAPGDVVAVLAPRPAPVSVPVKPPATVSVPVKPPATVSVPVKPPAPVPVPVDPPVAIAEAATPPATVSVPMTVTTPPTAAGSPPRARVVPRPALPAASTTPAPNRAGGRTRRRIGSAVVMTLAAGLIATMALPAYAFSTNTAFDPNNRTIEDSVGLGQQTLASDVGQVSSAVTRDNYQAPSAADLAAQKRAAAAAAAATAAAAVGLKLSSSGAISSASSIAYPSVVSPEVQALASELMGDVASGRLVGSRPDHIKEIQYLANGQVVDGCGVDYRVLQTIKLAVDTFNKVGVSDINRLCTGQIEGAGTISPHYRNGGGHAVDFYILNGHGLTGGDNDSMKFLSILDPVAPFNTNVGQAECRSSPGFTNLAEFDDGCSHLHVDFISAQGLQLSSD